MKKKKKLGRRNKKKKTVGYMGWVGRSRLVCLECHSAWAKQGVVVQDELPLLSDQEGWGVMSCDLCLRELQHVTPGYVGSEAEIPAEIWENESAAWSTESSRRR